MRKIEQASVKMASDTNVPYCGKCGRGGCT